MRRRYYTFGLRYILGADLTFGLILFGGDVTFGLISK